MAADVLSDLLKTVRLTGAVFFDVVAKSPWVAEQADSKFVLPKVLPNADHLISYHVVTQGRCYATMLGEEPIEVEAGEAIVFTRGDPHMLSSSPGMRANPANPDVLDAAVAGQLPVFVNYGAEGPVSAKFVCGFLACDARPFNPLLENLPPVIKASNAKDGGESWLSQFIRAAVAESANKRAGGESILAKLSELMFIEVVRRHLESLPPDQAGWLAGLRDSFVGKSLSLMHAKPAHDWTIEELAKQVGLSRSVFAERFTDLVGTPPLQYLAKWRMQIALGILDGSNANVATIAARVGYESEAAFSRAFKKIMGVPPSVWRQRGALRPAAERATSRN
jgi:AraC-like DNA-binding protein